MVFFILGETKQDDTPRSVNRPYRRFRPCVAAACFRHGITKTVIVVCTVVIAVPRTFRETSAITVGVLGFITVYYYALPVRECKLKGMASRRTWRVTTVAARGVCVPLKSCGGRERGVGQRRSQSRNRGRVTIPKRTRRRLATLRCTCVRVFRELRRHR